MSNGWILGKNLRHSGRRFILFLFSSSYGRMWDESIPIRVSLSYSDVLIILIDVSLCGPVHRWLDPILHFTRAKLPMISFKNTPQQRRGKKKGEETMNRRQRSPAETTRMSDREEKGKVKGQQKDPVMAPRNTKMIPPHTAKTKCKYTGGTGDRKGKEQKKKRKEKYRHSR